MESPKNKFVPIFKFFSGNNLISAKSNLMGSFSSQWQSWFSSSYVASVVEFRSQYRTIKMLPKLSWSPIINLVYIFRLWFPILILLIKRTSPIRNFSTFFPMKRIVGGVLSSFIGETRLMIIFPPSTSLFIIFSAKWKLSLQRLRKNKKNPQN